MSFAGRSMVHTKSCLTLIVLVSIVGHFSSSCSLTAALPLNTSIVVPENRTTVSTIHYTPTTSSNRENTNQEVGDPGVAAT